MLLLRRKIDEVVKIGDDIEVKVIAIDGFKVLLGFNAPKKIPVYRKEIYKRMQKENKCPSKFYEFSNVITY